MSETSTHVPEVAPDAPFEDALRAAIANRGLALNRIQAKLAARGLHVGVATLSTWQSGQRHPRPESRSVITALEDLLPRPDPAVPAAPYTVVDYAPALLRLLDEVRWDAYGRHHTINVVEEITLGPDRGMISRRVIQTLHATKDTDRQIIVHRGEPGGDVGLLSLTGVKGCRTGRVTRDTESGVMLGELLFDRLIPAGETVVVRYRIEDRSGATSIEYLRFFETPGPHYLLEVQFHPDAMPVRVSEVRRGHSREPDTLRRELMLSPDGRAHIAVPCAERGLAGIEWEWE
jgi:hypothetical protein